MEDLTEEFLRDRYGYIYDWLFKTPAESKKELVHRNNKVINKFLVLNPDNIFRTGNEKTINSFLNSFQKYEKNYKINHPKKYESFEKAKREWQTLKEVSKSKPVISNILKDMSLIEIEKIYSTNKELRNAMDRLGFWEKHLARINQQDNTDYQKNFKSKSKTVVTFFAIKELSEDIKNVGGWWERKDIYTYLHRISTLTLDRKNYKKSFYLLTQILPHLPNLKNLTLNNIKIGSLPDNFSDGPSNLTRLVIKGTRRVKNIPAGFFKNLHKLEYLAVTECFFKDLPDNLFKGLANLKELIFDDNKVKTISTGTFNDLVNLKKLCLIGNKVNSLPEGVFRNLVNLEDLNLTNMGLKRISRGMFEGLVNLKKLDLQINDIKILPETVFEDLENLKILILHWNPIKSIPENIKENIEIFF